MDLLLPELTQRFSHRWSRRSSKRLLKSPDLMSKEDLDEVVGNEAEKLLDERENELRRRLQGFENGTAK